MSEPRRHHYCPAGYLANFATPCDRNGRIIVVNPKTAQERPSTPNNEAHERDFYKIDTDGSSVDPFALEEHSEIHHCIHLAPACGFGHPTKNPLGSFWELLWEMSPENSPGVPCLGAP